MRGKADISARRKLSTERGRVVIRNAKFIVGLGLRLGFTVRLGTEATSGAVSTSPALS
jgi:hypothetical protein